MTRNLISIPGTLVVTFLLAGMVLVGTQGIVWPHEATSGLFVYPSGCCNSARTSATGDCDEIPSTSVIARADGYHVNLGIGQHPMLHTKGYSGVVPYQTARPSPDGQFHICLSTDGQSRYCFFAPPPGV